MNISASVLAYDKMVHDETVNRRYLDCNPDVRLAVENGHISSAFAHWLEYGKAEGRAWPVEEESASETTVEVIVETADQNIHERKQYLTYGIDRGTHEGIEIGALNWPILTPADVKVRFVDYTTQDELRRSSLASDPDRIVETDYVWSGHGSLVDVVGGSERFDFAIASHVIEHIPNVLGWLRRISGTLRSGGVFNLAVPDRRYTFDLQRRETALAEWVEADLLDYAFPSPRQTIDHILHVLHVAPGEPWHSDRLPADYVPMFGEERLRIALEKTRKLMQTGSYLDMHCSVFTPKSFLDLFAGATRMGLIDLQIERMYTTAPGSFEFYVNLRKPSSYSRQNLMRYADRARAMIGTLS